jgi:hypothetical protein
LAATRYKLVATDAIHGTWAAVPQFKCRRSIFAGLAAAIGIKPADEAGEFVEL